MSGKKKQNEKEKVKLLQSEVKKIQKRKSRLIIKAITIQKNTVNQLEMY